MILAWLTVDDRIHDINHRFIWLNDDRYIFSLTLRRLSGKIPATDPTEKPISGSFVDGIFQHELAQQTILKSAFESKFFQNQLAFGFTIEILGVPQETTGWSQH